MTLKEYISLITNETFLLRTDNRNIQFENKSSILVRIFEEPYLIGKMSNTIELIKRKYFNSMSFGLFVFIS